MHQRRLVWVAGFHGVSCARQQQECLGAISNCADRCVAQERTRFIPTSISETANTIEGQSNRPRHLYLQARRPARDNLEALCALRHAPAPKGTSSTATIGVY